MTVLYVDEIESSVLRENSGFAKVFDDLADVPIS